MVNNLSKLLYILLLLLFNKEALCLSKQLKILHLCVFYNMC